MSPTRDQKLMQRCLKLARQGAGFVSPNPLVGCVIVKNEKVLAEGWHKKFGGEHAEQVALRALAKKQKNKKTKKQFIGATVYVNLEPCSHYGKTPPCADVLIAAGVKRVVVGMKDPNPLVGGKGIRRLRAAGIAVAVGVLRKECEELNEAFTKWITTSRPFVLLKCAVTLDGALSFKKGTRTPLGCPETMRRVHQLRQEYDAIAVGINTVLIDNPLLTCRLDTKRKRNPVRVVFDTHLRIPDRARLLRAPGETIIFVGPKISKSKKDRMIKNYSQLKIITLPIDRMGHLSLAKAFGWLGRHGIISVMVEGGAMITESLLKQKLADKLALIFTPHIAPNPAAPRLFSTLSSLALKPVGYELMGSDVWMRAYL